MALKNNKRACEALFIGLLCSISYLAVYIARNVLSTVTPQMVEGGEYTLVVSMMGYEPQEQKIYVKNHQKLDFVLKENSMVMESVQVYGKSKSQQLRESAFSALGIPLPA